MERCRWFFAIILLSILPFASRSSVFAAPSTGSTIYLPLIANNWDGLQPKVVVLSNHSAYVDTANKLHIVGEVKNNSGGVISLVQVTAKIDNGSGQLVATKWNYVYPKVLPAGEKSCFDINLSAPTGWANYTFDPVTSVTGGTPLSSLVILSDKGAVSSGKYVITGQVRNEGASTINFVEPVGTLYDSTGKVIGCKSTSVPGLYLTAGQTSSFTLTFDGNTYTDQDTYHLLVDGTP